MQVELGTGHLVWLPPSYERLGLPVQAAWHVVPHVCPLHLLLKHFCFLKLPLFLISFSPLLWAPPSLIHLPLYPGPATFSMKPVKFQAPLGLPHVLHILKSQKMLINSFYLWPNYKDHKVEEVCLGLVSFGPPSQRERWDCSWGWGVVGEEAGKWRYSYARLYLVSPSHLKPTPLPPAGSFSSQTLLSSPPSGPLE